ncbi:uncharacterized protein si:dkey-29h14.10 [Trichomycterus rosablanca]|uniref:uncharacterized protein si:dkey-29h14.10 n=1 Tax=Trichomycterus rosablanca TaxID=2290929 RepID=UPI002F35C4B6
MVQQISVCLRGSRVLTDHEVQIIRAEPTESQQAARLLQTLLRKGSKSCLLFFRCLSACDRSLFHTVTRGAVKVSDEDHRHENCSFSGTTGSNPSSIINIHNSLLTNCIIGSNNGFRCQLSKPDVTSGTVEPMPRSDQQMATSDPAQTIQVESSKVKYVIIGDNNHMSVTCVESEPEEEIESEFEDLDG